MRVICPTVTAYDLREYGIQIERIAQFAARIHVDLMDGIFAPTKSPDIDKLWLPENILSDVHLMFQHPDKQVIRVLKMNPNMIIIPAEAHKQSVGSAVEMVKGKVRLGISFLADTKIDSRVGRLIRAADHALIFSGRLGYHGGKADLTLLHKVDELLAINPSLEIGWDGGINDFNLEKLSAGGVDVLNVGGYIQKSADPVGAYHKLADLLD